MSKTDDCFTNEQLTELALKQAQTSAQTGKALTATAHQAIAGLVMNALLLHELERLGLVDHDTLMIEAVERAKSIQPPEVGASVAQVIKRIFDGEAPTAPHVGPAGINGNPTDAKH
ncbi:hypothetical protein J2X36_000815 [Methylobacterium sp. BE186]|uniref:hypothetical protein n=1 Tax=Methylobacterium sp. BE186 TaxID=2817715 RepID=UPI0028557320|nr:hypothetical protein [Methylobacterium sp. BE186]MDR7036079.1 hypothetical protein [Methylobacterium sp. BE186]